MDRPIMYVDQIPLVEQFLTGYREAQTALGWIAQGMLGPGPYVDGLAVTQTSPPSMSVNIAPGQMFQIEDVDSTAYGNLDADVDHSVLKQFVSMDTVTETLVAPTTNGYAINYLIQVAASEVDADPELLPYYNSANPAQPFSGPPTNLNPPTSSGTEQMTRRACKVVINAKGGIPALSGQQTTPAPDAGYIGIYVVTVAQGATAIHSSDISTLPDTPWVTPKLCEIPRDVQSGMWGYAGVASLSGTAFAATLHPTPANLTVGMTIVVKMGAQSVANGTLNVNGFGAVSIVRRGGQACVGTEWLANDLVGFRWTGSSWQLFGITLADVPAPASPPVYSSGEGVQIDGGNHTNLAFPSLTEEDALADADTWAFWSLADNHHRKTTWGNIVLSILARIPARTERGLGTQVGQQIITMFDVLSGQTPETVGIDVGLTLSAANVATSNLGGTSSGYISLPVNTGNESSYVPAHANSSGYFTKWPNLSGTWQLTGWWENVGPPGMSFFLVWTRIV